MKTTMKIAIIAMMGMSLGVNAQSVPKTGGTFTGKVIYDNSSFRNHIQLKRLEHNFNNTWDITLTGGNSTNSLTFTAEGANGYSFGTRLHISASKTIFGQENNQWDLGRINNRFKKLYINEIDASGNLDVKGSLTVKNDIQNTNKYAKILLGSQNGDGLSVFGSMGAGQPANGTQDYGAYIGFNAYRDSNGNWKHLRTSNIGASRYTVGGDIASGVRGFNWEHSNNSGTGNITWNNIMKLDTSGNLDVKGSLTVKNDIQNTNKYAKILLGSQNGDGLSVFGSMGAGQPANGTQDYGAYIGFNAYRDSNGNWKHLRTSNIGASRYTVGGDIASGVRGFNWEHSNNSGTGNITWTNIMKLDTSGNLDVKGSANFGGNLGIGTISNGSHRLAVEGSIGAREIKVEAFPNWSDFVFEKKYNLPTLKEVENHIKEKGHLKDIPSAKEVEKNGFFLGEMDAKLLQKIEELTLYTIAQEKKLKTQRESFEQQQEEITSQKKEIEELKKQNSKFEKQEKKIERLESLIQKLLKDKN
ncbi:hypothetical protein SAMN04487765_2023 [Tenacibaculum sp. MAR_2010_89]|uniref:hypothetical protein n=1 Tax=Tenacibaculum sp. MAR_2010_89 TaxID=1250198 RepID=UPI00089ABDAB|nr:hypothetical protein [Tenacibaculum sp. MAR_2010_89]SEE28979.1 hypothetical protein SAMN04487765_2023 [Tenacibaculum sp. MAR_2010_89]